ncbi:MAG: hypothetical protein ACNA7I_06150 [Candidatus Methanoperedens sp.]
MSEICLEWGRSVAFGSGLYVDRIPDANTVEERKEMGVPYPDGDFRCIECEENYLKENGKLCQVCNNYETSVDKWEGFEAICQICKWDMEEAIKNIQNEEWACWTLSTDDITGIAKEKGISLAGKSIDDIARLVKKAIQWSLDEQWESIVADSIRDSKEE